MSSNTASKSSLKDEKTSLHTLHRSIVTIYVGPENYPFYFHKGRLCQSSPFFEKAFHGSFEEATTGSMYLEEDGVDEFVVFEEWLYSQKLSYDDVSGDTSLLLVKVFCFAERVEIPDLQNATLDAIRDRATEQHFSLVTPNTTNKTRTYRPGVIEFPEITDFQYQPFKKEESPTLEKPQAKYLPPATSNAIHYAYQNTPTASPLRKLLADIFAYNVKPEALDEDIISFPAEFMADVLLINMKRLPLRLEDEKAEFEMDAKNYHVHDSSSTRKLRVLEEVTAKETRSEDDSREEPPAEADVPASVWHGEPTILEPDIKAPVPDDEVTWGVFNSSSSRGIKKTKAKKQKRSFIYETPSGESP